ncbi:MAG TPA: ATP-dependent helicase HrpB [Steroidobacteraceae bacterium]|nr:ATP-dependent helicase HrpB [Steroidobacteraceae bacterium]
MHDPMRGALPELPIREVLPAIVRALDRSSRLLVEAPPGAGKSTIVPLALLEASWLADRKIVMLEPRRLAARAIASRIAQLLGEHVGERAGFRTRLESRTSRATRIEVVTEGILTRMIQDDAALNGCGCVVFDEFHERSVHADLGLALALEVQDNLRPDLRLIVMSATLAASPLARLLGGPAVVSAAGRQFAVDTHYLARRAELSIEQQTARTLAAAFAAEDGDALCFLPGAPEIRRVARLLGEIALPPGTRVLPLFGELDPASQDAALAPAQPGSRKIVLATSIAETSITIDGVRIVVDCGLSRRSEFDPATGMSGLATVKVSQAQADQRRGRAGRTAPGTCYRLWSEAAHAALAPHADAQILREDLAPLALELALWGATDAAALRWLDPPPPAHLAQARDLLRRLEAIDVDGRISAHGRAIARLGAHPRLAHMLERSVAMRACGLACDLAAILAERVVLRGPPGVRDADIRNSLAALADRDTSLRHGFSIDERARWTASRAAARWRRQLRCGRDEVDRDRAAGPLLALAYPDRVARSRGDGGRYLLANGRGATFAGPQALAKAPFLVAAVLDGAEREARIQVAAPIDLADLERWFAAQIEEHSEVRWDRRRVAVCARRERRLGALVLQSAEIADGDPGAVLAAMIAGIRDLGIGTLAWTPPLRQWQARVALLRRLAVAAPEQWPDLGDEALAATLEDWAAPWFAACTRREHCARVDLASALESRLTHAQRTVLAREAPTHLRVPSGSNVPIDYLDGDVPTVSVRLQELFGMTTTPSVAAGRMPLLLKLLSPAGRPVQVTRDLVSFWNHTYHEVRKDLKGRYPKHYWPEDPHHAQPTRRVRPR